MTEYNDETFVSTRKYGLKKLKDIPASYFIYCYENGFVNNLMKAYIEKNLERFKMEAIAEKQQRKAQRNFERR
jgi:hypothetical protein